MYVCVCIYIYIYIYAGAYERIARRHRGAAHALRRVGLAGPERRGLEGALINYVSVRHYNDYHMLINIIVYVHCVSMIMLFVWRAL